MPSQPATTLVDREFGRSSVLFGERGGRYPHGNSLLVRGGAETVLIDPSLAIPPRSRDLPRIDRVLATHCHEDHIAGLHLFPAAPCHFHQDDLPGIQSLEGFMAIYGMEEPLAEIWRKTVVGQFHFVARPDALAFQDGDVFDLGGGVRIHVLHAPGHTRGHSVFYVEPDELLYLGDIDLSSFGPYYGDAWSSLEDFERTLEKLRDFEARWYATFHHIGVLEGRPAFQDRLGRFAAVIGRREQQLIDFLAEPHSLDEVVAHRFVYRPQDSSPLLDPVERRSMSQHLDRLLRAGRVEQVETGRYRAC